MIHSRSERETRKRSNKTEWWWEDLPSHPLQSGWQRAIRTAQTEDQDLVARLPRYDVAPGVS